MDLTNALALADKIETMEDYPGDVAMVECIVALRDELRMRSAKAPVPKPDTTLPRYQCHKRVHAVKIKELRTPFQSEGPYDLGDFMIVPEEAISPFLVKGAFVRKHQPQVGGYWVIYEDGYQSYSPAEAFESGYTKLEEKFPFAKGVEVSIKPEYTQTAERRAGALEEICAALQRRTGIENWHPDVIALMNAYHRAEQLTDPQYVESAKSRTQWIIYLYEGEKNIGTAWVDTHEPPFYERIHPSDTKLGQPDGPEMVEPLEVRMQRFIRFRDNCYRLENT